MIDTLRESVLSLAQVPQFLPPGRGGRPVCFRSVLRWVQEGQRAPDGRIVKLEAIRIGGRLCTSREALQRFGEALTYQSAREAEVAHV
jgi:hypothetical protein